ncbi:MAG: hypothetical protein JWM41_2888 [Gemmatimonadetes bacterium]|nr:hypothetical protein [Gemmatimonadota bacterium]
MLRLRFKPLAPDCEDCGFPLERVLVKITGYIFAHRRVYAWGDGNGRCAECAQVRRKAETLEAEQRESERIARETEKARERVKGRLVYQASRMISAPTVGDAWGNILGENYTDPPLGLGALKRDSNAETAFEMAWLRAHPRPTE